MTLDLNGLIPATVLPMNGDGSIDEPALRRYIGWVVESGAGRPGDQRRYRRGTASHPRREGPYHPDRPRRDGHPRSWRGSPAPRPMPRSRQATGTSRPPAPMRCRVPDPRVPELSRLNPAVPVAVPRPDRLRPGLPLILFQLQPALAGVNYDADVPPRRWCEVDGVIAIKEASFDARRFVDTARLLERLPKKVTLLTGNDNFILESFLLGATGALIGFGAVMTREQVDMIRAWQEGRTEECDGARSVASSASPTSCSQRPSAITEFASKSVCASWACSSPASVRPPSCRSTTPSASTSRPFSKRSACSRPRPLQRSSDPGTRRN